MIKSKISINVAVARNNASSSGLILNPRDSMISSAPSAEEPEESWKGRGGDESKRIFAFRPAGRYGKSGIGSRVAKKEFLVNAASTSASLEAGISSQKLAIKL